MVDIVNKSFCHSLFRSIMRPLAWRYGEIQEGKLMPWLQGLGLGVRQLVQEPSSRRKTQRSRLFVCEFRVKDREHIHIILY